MGLDPEQMLQNTTGHPKIKLLMMKKSDQQKNKNSGAKRTPFKFFTFRKTGIEGVATNFFQL